VFCRVLRVHPYTEHKPVCECGLWSLEGGRWLDIAQCAAPCLSPSLHITCRVPGHAMTITYDQHGYSLSAARAALAAFCMSRSHCACSIGLPESCAPILGREAIASCGAMTVLPGWQGTCSGLHTASGDKPAVLK